VDELFPAWSSRSQGALRLYDTVTREAALDVPYMYNKCSPLPIFVPGPGADSDTNDNDGGHGSIYIMEARPAEGRPQDAMKPSYQYEAFIHHRRTGCWERQLLPPPPFVCDPKVVNPSITSHELAGPCPWWLCCLPRHLDICGWWRRHLHTAWTRPKPNTPDIWISVDGGAGTYCLDTAKAKHTWTKVGNWTLAFDGKAEYVVWYRQRRQRGMGTGCC
jgi:hypothetical protein